MARRSRQPRVPHPAGKSLPVDPVRIAIAIPSHDQCPFLFAYDLANMVAYTVAAMPDGVHLGLNAVTGTYVPNARQELTEEMVRQGADWVLWLDSDMRFPNDLLVRLLRHRAQMVGVNYSTRSADDPHPVAIKRVGLDGPGERLRTGDDSAGLEEVEAVGFGAVLIRGDVLAALPPLSDGPWFNIEWMPDRREWIGEDVFFCRLLRKMGVKIQVDHDLSKEIRHVGNAEYQLQWLPEWGEK